MRIPRLFFIAAVAALCMSGCKKIPTPQEQAPLYAAYCKINNCNGLTLDEWHLLWRQRMLPGQRQCSADNSAAAAAGLSAAAIAISASAAARR